SYVATATVSPMRGQPLDIDIATIGGVQYVAATSIDVGNINDFTYHLSVVRTSDMALIFDHIYDPGGSAGEEAIPLAFDASGNVWWAPLKLSVGFNNQL